MYSILVTAPTVSSVLKQGRKFMICADLKFQSNLPTSKVIARFNGTTTLYCLVSLIFKVEIPNVIKMNVCNTGIQNLY